jgi:hypothetical protein
MPLPSASAPATRLPTRARLIAGSTVAFTLLAGCLVSTSGLSGGDTCEGSECPTLTVEGGGLDASSDGAPNACDANVTTDNANCGSCSHVCGADTPRCFAGACSVGCAGGVVYVSPAGSDTANGCTPDTALATVTQAINQVTGQMAVGEEIHVCHGTFAEPNIVLDQPISLLGGYDCTTWTRTATYGYPSFDRVNETILATNSGNLSGDTVGIAGQTVTNATLFDGFTVQSPAAAGTFSKIGAVLVSGGASPTISNDDLEGAPAVPGIITVGLRLILQGTPLVTNDMINGGGGSLGSIGIDATQSSALYVHDNTINGGSSPSQGWGILANSDVSLPGQPEYITHNVIKSGTGTTVKGIDLTDSNVSIIGNTLEGGAAACAGGDCAALGIRLYADEAGSFSFTVAQNRVVAGTVNQTVTTGGSTQEAYGLFVATDPAGANSLSRIDLLDNAIQAGSGTTPAVGISMQTVAQANVQGNTVYGYTNALSLGSIAHLDVDGNLLMTDAKTTSLAVSACTGTIGIESFSSNAFVNTGNLLAPTSGACATTLTTVTSIESLYAPQAVRGSSGNRRVAANCEADAGASTDNSTQCATIATCVVGQTDPGACIGAVLANWTDASQGSADLLDDARTWKLNSKAPCAVAQGISAVLTDSSSLDAGPTNYDALDILGVARKVPISIGAYQDNGACTP